MNGIIQPYDLTAYYSPRKTIDTKFMFIWSLTSEANIKTLIISETILRPGFRNFYTYQRKPMEAKTIYQ